MPSTRSLASLRKAAFFVGVALGVAGCGDGVGEPIHKDTSLGNGGTGGNDYCASVEDWDQTAANDEAGLATALTFLRSFGESCGTQSWDMPLPALTQSPELRCSARLHSQDMAKSGVLSETGTNGDEPADRMRRAGYVASDYGELVLRGSGATLPLGDRGFDCEGLEELVDSRWVAVGVGRFQDFWTVDLAGMRAP